MADVARALKKLSPTVRRMLELACEGEWERVTVDGHGQFTVHNKKPKASKPVAAHLQIGWQTAGEQQKPTRRVWCGRCEQDGHFVEDCPQPLKPLAAPPKQKEKLRSAPLHEFAVALGVKKPAVSSTTVVSAPERVYTSASVWVEPDEGAAFDWDAVDLKQTAYRFCEQYRSGLPAGIGFSYLPEVLALWGLDTVLTEDCLRAPERVEVRPESFRGDKGYPVLGFYRGDVSVILGLREPVRPCIIAVYVGAKLENDHHRVNNHGGGAGGKSDAGLPKTPTQLMGRLRGLGAIVEPDSDHKKATVLYKGNDLGKVNIDRTATRSVIETEWQRTQRRIAGVNRAAAS